MSYRQLFEQLGVSFTRTTGNEAQAKCPLHGDDTPSLSVNLESGLWKCFAGQCNKGGNASDFQRYLEELKEELTVNIREVEAHHQLLLKDQEMLRYVHETRGLTQDTIYKYKLGMESGRLWIPIRGTGEIYHNVRRHSITGKTKFGKTIGYGIGYNRVRLWPAESLNADTIWICEGELDCLVLLQLGFSAVTGTGGAGSWKPEWVKSFVGKRVRIVYDVDAAGLEGSRKVAESLIPFAKEVKMIMLPCTPPNKDITDFVVKERKGYDELIQLEHEAKPVENQAPSAKDTKIYEVDLHRAGQQDMVGKQIKFQVVVAGKDLAPFSAPKDVRFTCRMGLRICGGCSIARNNGVMRSVISGGDPQILKLIDCSDEQQRIHIRKMVGIVPSCPRFDMEVETYQNLEELRLLPEIDFSPDVDTEYVIRSGYYVGDGIRTNQTYEAKGIVTPHPRNQYITFVLPDMKPTRSNLQTYEPTPESIDRLKKFQPLTTVMERLKDIAADLTSNVTRIYKREDLIHATDLVLHSVLGFSFQDQPVQRGWVEGLIVGDTRCGKSETLKTLIRHYRVGEIVTGENVSYAGLVGGLQQIQERWSITWGKIPLNDRRALVIDEVSGMPLTDIERMSGIRSSGIAEISKIQTERTLARTRLLWASNPRSARPVNTYDSGAQIIKELIGKPEDIARFDYAIIVSTSEVPIEVVNARQLVKLPHQFNTELCHELIMWIWSRTRDQVIFTDEATQTCLDHASQFSKEYSSELPLVEPNEQRIKFARLGAAVAARVFSTEDGKNLLVKSEHVEVAATLLRRWYTNTNFNYRFFSELKLKELDLTKEDEIVVKNVIYPHGIKFCQALLGHSFVKLNDIEDMTGRERKDAKLILGTLVQCGALKRKSYGYIKTPGFIRLLRETKAVDLGAPPPAF